MSSRLRTINLHYQELNEHPTNCKIMLNGGSQRERTTIFIFSPNISLGHSN